MLFLFRVDNLHRLSKLHESKTISFLDLCKSDLFIVEYKQVRQKGIGWRFGRWAGCRASTQDLLPDKHFLLPREDTSYNLDYLVIF